MPPAVTHHVGICPADVDASLRFYRDGIGLSVLVDTVIESNLHAFVGVHTYSVRTIFLGDPDLPQQGIVELMAVVGDVDVTAEATPPARARRGVCLLSFQLPVDPILARLAALGLGGDPWRVSVPGGGLAARVTDPDGTLVELLDQPTFQ